MLNDKVRKEKELKLVIAICYVIINFVEGGEILRPL
jgi:hypothetical protein